MSFFSPVGLYPNKTFSVVNEWNSPQTVAKPEFTQEETVSPYEQIEVEPSQLRTDSKKIEDLFAFDEFIRLNQSLEEKANQLKAKALIDLSSTPTPMIVDNEKTGVFKKRKRAAASINQRKRQKTNDESENLDMNRIKQQLELHRETTQNSRKIEKLKTSILERQIQNTRESRQSTPPQVSSTEFQHKTLTGNEVAQIRFSQKTISETLSDETTYVFKVPLTQDQLLEKLMKRNHVLTDRKMEESFSEKDLSLVDTLRRDGWDKSKEPLQTVKMPDNVLTSFDNRRLAAAKTIIEHFSNSLTICCDIHSSDQQAPQRIWKQVNSGPDHITPMEGIKYDSYGHALLARITHNGQYAPCFGYTELPQVRTCAGTYTVQVKGEQITLKRNRSPHL
jgi:hypothetical protein